MGSLSSPPKTPKVQQIRYVQPSIAQTVLTTKKAISQPEINPEKEASQARRAGLLLRDRGRSGTIATSLKGFLEAGNRNSGRKTLLGE